MKVNLKQGFTLIELLVVITIIAVLASLSIGAIGKMTEKGSIIDSVNNCRNIVQAIKIYASDESGIYPDQDQAEPASTSNIAFRTLVKSDKVDQEKMFGAQVSKYRPDGNLGTAPNYDEAVKAGENHWMMTADLNEAAPGAMPLVYENAVATGTDPTWNADAAGRTVRGRTWSGGRIIVGRNDGSVALEKCEAAKGASVKLKQLGEAGKNLFTQYSEGEGAVEFKILDIEEGEN
jgi:prepilin-type N-terminal cleavage/methylation domain-containing protein